MKTFLTICACALFFPLVALADDAKIEWEPLFDGKNMEGEAHDTERPECVPRTLGTSRYGGRRGCARRGACSSSFLHHRVGACGRAVGGQVALLLCSPAIPVLGELT